MITASANTRDACESIFGRFYTWRLSFTGAVFVPQAITKAFIVFLRFWTIPLQADKCKQLYGAHASNAPNAPNTPCTLRWHSFGGVPLYAGWLNRDPCPKLRNRCSGTRNSWPVETLSVMTVIQSTGLHDQFSEMGPEFKWLLLLRSTLQCSFIFSQRILNFSHSQIKRFKPKCLHTTWPPAKFLSLGFPVLWDCARRWNHNYTAIFDKLCAGDNVL